MMTYVYSCRATNFLIVIIHAINYFYRVLTHQFDRSIYAVSERLNVYLQNVTTVALDIKQLY